MNFGFINILFLSYCIFCILFLTCDPCGSDEEIKIGMNSKRVASLFCTDYFVIVSNVRIPRAVDVYTIETSHFELTSS